MSATHNNTDVNHDCIIRFGSGCNFKDAIMHMGILIISMFKYPDFTL